MTDHGTTGGYRAHYTTGDLPACEPCRAAQSKAAQVYSRRRYFNRGVLTIDGTGTNRRLQALAALGWSQSELASRLGFTFQNVSRLASEGRVNRDTAAKVRALYDELSMTSARRSVPADLALRKGWTVPSPGTTTRSTTRQRARRRWSPTARPPSTRSPCSAPPVVSGCGCPAPNAPRWCAG
jgi:transcriptional regulator with XRE-family HTH domain